MILTYGMGLPRYIDTSHNYVYIFICLHIYIHIGVFVPRYEKIVGSAWCKLVDGSFHTANLDQAWIWVTPSTPYGAALRQASSVLAQAGSGAARLW